MTYDQERLLIQFVNWLAANDLLDLSSFTADRDTVYDDEDTLYLDLIEEFENDG